MKCSPMYFIHYVVDPITNYLIWYDYVSFVFYSILILNNFRCIILGKQVIPQSINFHLLSACHHGKEQEKSQYQLFFHYRI